MVCRTRGLSGGYAMSLRKRNLWRNRFKALGSKQLKSQSTSQIASADIPAYWFEQIKGASLSRNNTYASESSMLREFYRDAQHYALVINHNGDPEVALLMAIEKEAVARTHPSGTYNIDADREPGRTIDENLGMLAGRFHTRPRKKSRAISHSERADLLRLRILSGQRSTRSHKELGLAASAPTKLGRLSSTFTLASTMPGAIGDAMRIIRPRNLSSVAFPSVVEKWAISSERCESMLRFMSPWFRWPASSETDRRSKLFGTPH